MDGVGNTLYVVLKQISKLDGTKTDEFFEWSSNLRVSLNIYIKKIFNIIQGQERPSQTDDGQAASRAA